MMIKSECQMILDICAQTQVHMIIMSLDFIRCNFFATNYSCGETKFYDATYSFYLVHPQDLVDCLYILPYSGINMLFISLNSFQICKLEQDFLKVNFRAVHAQIICLDMCYFVKDKYKPFASFKSNILLLY